MLDQDNVDHVNDYDDVYFCFFLHVAFIVDTFLVSLIEYIKVLRRIIWCWNFIPNKDHTGKKWPKYFVCILSVSIWKIQHNWFLISTKIVIHRLKIWIKFDSIDPLKVRQHCLTVQTMKWNAHVFVMHL